MRAYRNAAAHQRAMPHLLRWCDEASVVHWQQAQADLPELATACQRMVADGRLSKVRYPSPLHAAKQITPRHTPRAGLLVRPRTAQE